jgi:cephalosporin-C deacetylase-like acetyl esterase
MSQTLRRLLSLSVIFCLANLPHTLAAQTLHVAPSHADGVYAAGVPIVWTVTVENGAPGSVSSGHYVVKYGGGKVETEGDFDLSSGSAQIQYTATDPAAYLVVVTAKSSADSKSIHADGGAVFDADKIKPSLPRPADFDSFWKSKLAEVRAIDPASVVTQEDCGIPGVVYETVTMANIDGSHVYAQVAYPTGGAHLPAQIILQWAGVYGLHKDWVTTPARNGWLAINVMPHDLPLNMPDSFYENAKNTTLRDYIAIGFDDRDKSYFLRMILGDIRAADYIQKRPEWDGKTLIATGTSQGGYQSIALAGLDPAITAIMVLVPAGCDITASAAGRAMPWPYWLAHATQDNAAKVQQVAQYYDTVNFASNVHCPALAGIGLIDHTSTPNGDLAMFNQLAGPKQKVLLPFSDHLGHGNAQGPYHPIAARWLDLLKQDKNPVQQGN